MICRLLSLVVTASCITCAMLFGLVPMALLNASMAAACAVMVALISRWRLS